MSAAGPRGATVQIAYTIARHPDNRRYYISWGDEYGPWGGKGESLNGTNAQVVFPHIFIDRLYEGNYTVVLQLTRIENGEEKEFVALARFSVH